MFYFGRVVCLISFTVLRISLVSAQRFRPTIVEYSSTLTSFSCGQCSELVPTLSFTGGSTPDESSSLRPATWLVFSQAAIEYTGLGGDDFCTPVTETWSIFPSPITYYKPADVSANDFYQSAKSQFLSNEGRLTCPGDTVPVTLLEVDILAVPTQPVTITPNTSPQGPSIPASTSSATTGQPAPESDQSSESSGLSTGAKIGIGVGVPAAVLVLAFLCFGLWRRNRRKHAVVTHELNNEEARSEKVVVNPSDRAESRRDGSPHELWDGSTLPHEQRSPRSTPPELRGEAAHELSPEREAHELWNG